MEGLFLWIAGIAWGVKVGSGITSFLLVLAGVAGVKSPKDEDKKIAKICIRMSIAFAVICVLFPPESVWCGWIELINRP